MEQQFKSWLINKGYSETGAANSYSRAIPHISRHYSEQSGINTDIFAISEQNKISEIARDYSQSGKFSDFGDKQHGRYRAAIARYAEFFVHKSSVDDISPSIESDYEDQTEYEGITPEYNHQLNFAYEKDLQTTLCAQIPELFPGYKIFGNNNEGVEYAIEDRRVDILLENACSGDLLAVELKSGIADFRVFGQISMYLGLLRGRFPDKKVHGSIVAGAIDKSLRQACMITDEIGLKIYRMSLELENA